MRCTPGDPANARYHGPNRVSGTLRINVIIPLSAPETLSNEVHGGTSPCNQAEVSRCSDASPFHNDAIVSRGVIRELNVTPTGRWSTL